MKDNTSKVFALFILSIVITNSAGAANRVSDYAPWMITPEKWTFNFLYQLRKDSIVRPEVYRALTKKTHAYLATPIRVNARTNEIQLDETIVGIKSELLSEFQYSIYTPKIIGQLAVSAPAGTKVNYESTSDDLRLITRRPGISSELIAIKPLEWFDWFGGTRTRFLLPSGNTQNSLFEISLIGGLNYIPQSSAFRIGLSGGPRFYTTQKFNESSKVNDRRISPIWSAKLDGSIESFENSAALVSYQTDRISSTFSVGWQYRQ